jgi:hypothetical protein
MYRTAVGLYDATAAETITRYAIEFVDIRIVSSLRREATRGRRL